MAYLYIMPVDKTKSRAQVVWLGLALVVLTLFLFWPATRFDFIDFDDYGYVKENRHVRNGLTADSIRWAFTTPHEQWYLPLLWLSFMADTEIQGTDPSGYHLTNILLHAVNAGLLLWILFRLTGSVWTSAFVAALFAFHPTRVEAVAWVTARKDTLSGLFFMLSLLAYLRYCEQPSPRRYTLLPILMLLGVLSKSIVVVLPALLLLLDYWPLRRIAPANWYRLLVEKLPLFGIAALFVVITLVTHETGRGVHTNVAMADRFGLIFPNYWDYLRKIFWPPPLSIYYPYTDIANWPISSLALVGLLGLTSGALYLHRSHPHIIVGWLWFLLALFPIIRGMRLGLAQYADRFTYLPIIGLTVAVVWTVREWLSRSRPAAAALAILVLGACAVQTRSYLPAWQNTATVFGHAWHIFPDSSLINLNYGQALCNANRYDEGLPLLYRAATQLRPDNYEIPNVLGAQLNRVGRHEEALAYLDKSIVLKPDYAPAHNNRGNALDKLGRREDAMRAYRKALHLEPDFADAHYNLANVLFFGQRLQDALSHYQEAVQHDPNLALAWYNLGITHAQLGHFADALRCIRRSLELNPQMPDAKQTLRQIQMDMRQQ